MASLNCALSLRPVEGLSTTLFALKNDDVALTTGARKSMREQHTSLIIGSNGTDAEYVPIAQLHNPQSLWNPNNKPLLGIQARGAVKNDQAGQKGPRTCGVNPASGNGDNFCLVTPVVALLQAYPPVATKPIWSGLPQAQEQQGLFYYRTMAKALHDFAVEQNLDPLRLNPHVFRLYGMVQLTAAGASEIDTANQGNWSHAANKAKGALVYYRSSFWNHGLRLATAMHDKSTPLGHLDKYRIGLSVAPTLNRRDTINLRIVTMVYLIIRPPPRSTPALTGS
jgi:hypothetical protein